MSDASVLPGRPAASRTRGGQGAGSGHNVSFSAARGAGLVALAVILGIVLLQVIDDGTSGPIGDGGSSGKGVATSSTTTTGGSSTTSTTKVGTPARPPAQVEVLVLNGSGKPGVAKTLSNKLQANGYQTLAPADAPKRQGTVVYAKATYGRECATVATHVDGNPKVEPVPAPPPTASDKANCIVIIGT